ncbi:MAG TPA: sensor domain-containing diguanylate cyclase [Beijerinckiaceae bacterium]|nr:sensor domain-containing diguanylate cyclase [Beijerinckiaceae bacterium]
MSIEARSLLGDLRLARKITAIRLLAVVAMAGLIAFFAYVIFDARRDAEVAAQQAATSLTTAIAQDISRNFELYGLSLQGVIQGLKNPAIAEASPELRQLALFDYASKARYLNRIVVIDANGRAIAQSQGDVLPKENFADRNYFKVQQRANDDILYVSEPLQSRIDQDWIIVVSRRIANADGSFGGVVAGSVSLAYFQALFMNLNAHKDDAFAVLSSDGVLISRQPFSLMDIGKRLGQTTLLRAIENKQTAIFTAVSPIDGMERLYGAARVPNLPLIVTYAMPEKRIYTAWRQKALTLSAMVLGLCAALAALGLMLLREFRLRRKFEIKLAAAAGHLKALSRIDQLTKLPNRRAFDERSALEWRRGAREKSSLSILVIDVDHFKQYNDRNGHVAGDMALAVVAHCIRKHIKRPADFAARYGGEEFAVLLPSTAPEGAEKVAEDIRRSVQLAHLSNQIVEPLSVSIGVTMVTPTPGRSFQDAFKLADEALYGAKTIGRNRVVFVPADGATRAATSTNTPE